MVFDKVFVGRSVLMMMRNKDGDWITHSVLAIWICFVPGDTALHDE